MYFKRNIESLSAIFDFLDAFYLKYGLSGDVSFALNLAVEEIFTNLVKYNQGNIGKVRITLKKEEGRAVVVIADFALRPFDVTQVKSNVHSLPLEKRPPGKLGLHLVKNVIDELKYVYNEQKHESAITLIKYLGENHVADQR